MRHPHSVEYGWVRRSPRSELLHDYYHDGPHARIAAQSRRRNRR